MYSKLYMVVTLILSVISLSIADTEVVSLPEHPGHPGKCWSEKYRRALGPGADWQPNDVCETVKCIRIPNYMKRFMIPDENGVIDSYVIHYISCDNIDTFLDGYVAVQDMTQSFPDCCPKFKRA